MSTVSAWAVEIVNIFARARHGREAGAALYGPDLSKWPAWAVDALVVIEGERIAIEIAKFEAEQSERD